MINTHYLSNFVRHSRSNLGLTQVELAERAGVGLRFIRELEQGKTTLRMDKVNQVLSLFGYGLIPGKELDPFDVYEKNFNQNVRISLKNKSIWDGFITGTIKEGGIISAWQFVKKNDIIKYQQTKDVQLITTIPHHEIERIVNI
ncbi:helix-turn-helix transcriptional regulator [Chitinophaga sp. MM2321]|uniref:helix-turn-helix transcriptional regulator n=1 Tax=Chitinophaga sp. MM2321 TaxID=3137178 RepID=UPI0032D58AA1